MDEWVRSYAAGLGAAVTRGSPVRWVEAPSGARLAFVAGVALKFHHGDHRQLGHLDLARRLSAVSHPPLDAVFIPPLASSTGDAPDGSLVSAWPEVPVLAADDRIPWSEAGLLLARLHRLEAPASLPRHSPSGRLARSLERAEALPQGPDRTLLVELGRRLLREVAEATSEQQPAQRHTAELLGPQGGSTVHGDFHLGQLGLWQGAWRLLDLDDLGIGDPAWDLARPAGFWAAGLVTDRDWADFLDGYRDAGGPAVPAVGDPWPPLDLPARCAVHVAAVRVLTRAVHSDLTAHALLAACRRM